MLFTDQNRRNRQIIAEFQELDYKQHFQVVAVEPHSWGDQQGFKYEIAVGSLGETRYCNLLKTRAIVAVDQDDHGHPITKSWKIRFIHDSRTA